MKIADFNKAQKVIKNIEDLSDVKNELEYLVDRDEVKDVERLSISISSIDDKGLIIKRTTDIRIDFTPELGVKIMELIKTEIEGLVSR